MDMWKLGNETGSWEREEKMKQEGKMKQYHLLFLTFFSLQFLLNLLQSAHT